MFNAEGLKRQAKCYLACLNSLSLVNEKYAWIVKPNLRASMARTADELPAASLALAPGVSPKRNHEGEEVGKLLSFSSTLHPIPSRPWLG